MRLCTLPEAHNVSLLFIPYGKLSIGASCESGLLPDPFMLTLPEKIIFAIAVLATAYLSYRSVQRLVAIIGRGRGEIDLALARKRVGETLAKTISLQPVFRFRFWTSFFHGLVSWAFMYYLLVNLGDVLEGYLPGYHFLGKGFLGGVYRLGADILSVGALVGMLALIIRRFAIKPEELTNRENILLHPKARQGIRRDSAIVGGFILVHVGSRFLGESFAIAVEGVDSWQPFATQVAGLWVNLSLPLLSIGQHVAYWMALGSILLFVPYFPYTKHIHLFMAPLNFLLRPEYSSIGQLDALDFDDDTIEQFGATHLEDLGWSQILDAYACIMCYRCQEVCPAYHTGKVLSPATLEINKRYFLNQEGNRLATGVASTQRLLEFAITEEAIWACTACGACTDICPVGNDPMRDILDIRRSMVLMENRFPDPLQTAFRGMERSVNPWSIPASERLAWAEGYSVPTIDQNPTPEILWWVGCAPASVARAQKTAQAFARVLNKAGVNYAVLGPHEQCTGDSARRAGNEYLFFELATANVELLNEVNPPRIVTTCPHCLHTLKTEYPAFGGEYQVIHHTQLINELVGAGRLKLNSETLKKMTFHDPCYLGRHNQILIEPRMVLQPLSNELVEMKRNRAKSFCCGAGGAQMWKEEEKGVERVSTNRMREADATGASVLATGCPFCMVMLSDAAGNETAQLEILDIVEIVAASLEES